VSAFLAYPQLRVLLCLICSLLIMFAMSVCVQVDSLQQSVADADAIRAAVRAEMSQVVDLSGRLTEENLQLRSRLEAATDRLVRALHTVFAVFFPKSTPTGSARTPVSVL
jgi:hypothetical protein